MTLASSSPLNLSDKALSLEQLIPLRWAILGAGREGQALIRWWKASYPQHPLTVLTEQAPQWPDDLPWDGAQDRLIVGPFDSTALAAFQVLVKSPGISPFHPALKTLPPAVQFTSTTNLWFARHGGRRVLAITGTKGKSTTSALTAHLLRAAGLKVELVGNIGVPALERLDHSADWWVMELSSYQCADLTGTPEVGVVLSLFPEHLDWHGSETRYLSDKARLLSQAQQAWAPQTLQEQLYPLLGSDPALWARLRWLQQAGSLQPQAAGVFCGDQLLVSAQQLPLRGLHNIHNICVAWELARYAGVSDEQVIAALARFRALPHRLQDVGVYGGLRYINDSISTTPHAAIAALEACAGTPLCILVGGHDRGISWQAFAKHLQHSPCHTVVAMGLHGQRIAALLHEQGLVLAGGIHLAADLAEAMKLARQQTPSGGIVLLSPGAPSYGEFKNFEKRGECFSLLAHGAA